MGELSSGHWSNRDLPDPHNIKRQKLSAEISISTLRPSSTQRPASYSAGHPMPNNKQDRNTTPPSSREAASNHNKVTDTKNHTTQHSPVHEKYPASSTRTQAPVLSNRKSTQPTEPTLAAGDRYQKQRELRTCSL